MLVGSMRAGGVADACRLALQEVALQEVQKVTQTSGRGPHSDRKADGLRAARLLTLGGPSPPQPGEPT
jgi:hypothetical protein